MHWGFDDHASAVVKAKRDEIHQAELQRKETPCALGMKSRKLHNGRTTVCRCLRHLAPRHCGQLSKWRLTLPLRRMYSSTTSECFLGFPGETQKIISDCLHSVKVLNPLGTCHQRI